MTVEQDQALSMPAVNLTTGIENVERVLAFSYATELSDDELATVSGGCCVKTSDGDTFCAA